MNNEPQTSPVVWYKRRTNLSALVFLGAASVYILTEHWAHAVPYLPWLILLACPLMHIFMHHGHGGHGAHGGHGERNEAREASSTEGENGAEKNRSGNR
ncbi:MAG: DUF2933 domain-containing protein [bacterium]